MPQVAVEAVRHREAHLAGGQHERRRQVLDLEVRFHRMRPVVVRRRLCRGRRHGRRRLRQGGPSERQDRNGGQARQHHARVHARSPRHTHARQPGGRCGVRVCKMRTAAMTGVRPIETRSSFTCSVRIYAKRRAAATRIARLIARVQVAALLLFPVPRAVSCPDDLSAGSPSRSSLPAVRHAPASCSKNPTDPSPPPVAIGHRHVRPDPRRRATPTAMRVFSPQTLTTNVGATVTWTNADSITHSSVADAGQWKADNIAARGHVPVHVRDRRHVHLQVHDSLGHAGNDRRAVTRTAWGSGLGARRLRLFLKPQASSLKPQASSLKPQAPSPKPVEPVLREVVAQRALADAHRLGGVLLDAAGGVQRAADAFRARSSRGSASDSATAAPAGAATAAPTMHDVARLDDAAAAPGRRRARRCSRARARCRAMARRRAPPSRSGAMPSMRLPARAAWRRMKCSTSSGMSSRPRRAAAASRSE